MIILAESGSSKTDWCFIKNGEVLQKVSSIGLNPYFVDSSKISDTITQNVLPAFNNSESINDIYFYGAGCSTSKMCEIVRQGLFAHFPTANIEVQSDMIAAARGLCGEGPGIVSILGTGSNSCAFSGGKIIEQSPALGYVLGDEGSGTDIGKRLLKAFCYKELKPELQNAFELKYKISKDDVLEAIYKKAMPNRYIASFVPFINEHSDESLFRFVHSAFAGFLQQHIMRYESLPHKTPLYFTGSVAYIFSDILKEEVEKHSLILGNITQSPLAGLIEYHRNKR
ncbi:MAG TPA: hypothetical protein PKM97_12950 [Bacteroidia bacterium]|nr:hypothetical protein [Bacteroidia bacterium]